MSKVPGAVDEDSEENPDFEDNPDNEFPDTVPSSSASAARHGPRLPEKVSRIKKELGIKAKVSMSEVAKQACHELGIDPDGKSLKKQIDMAYDMLFAGAEDSAQTAAATHHTFRFQSPFDTNGVLYWLGTAQGTAPYQNPHRRGAVVASMSSKEPAPRPWGQDPRGDEARFVNNQVDHPGAYNTTGNMHNAWMAVDLGNGCALKVDHYCLRHGDFGSGMHKMQRWVLEGSMDGVSWTVLNEHNEPGHSEWMRGGAFCIGHWPVHTSLSCRHFRIRMTAENHNHTGGNGLALLCAGIELYGSCAVSGGAKQAPRVTNEAPRPSESVESVTVRMSADDHIDDVFYNDQSLRHLIGNIGTGVGEVKVFQFNVVPGAVLAIAAHDNQPGNSASFFLEAKSTDPSSSWNIQLRPGHPMVKAWGSPHSEKPSGWYRNSFDDGSWTSPSAETHTHWSRHHGMSPGVWCQSNKFTAYRISPSCSGGSVAPTLLPRDAQDSRAFRFQSAFDTNGVLYWLGTAKGTAPYRNPHRRGAVVATMSSKEPAPRPWGKDPRGDEARFVNNQVDHHGAYNTTGNMHNAWMAVDLGSGCALRVDHYCLRHGDWGSGMHKMQRWVLEGSMDGANWIVLKEHNEPGHSDWMKGGAFCTGHWPVETSLSCRHFRIRMTAENHHHTNGNGLALLCAGIELYGVMRSSGGAAQAPPAVIGALHSSERVDVRMSADDHIDDVFYNDQSLRHLIRNIGSGVGEVKVFQFDVVPGAVLAIAAHDNQPGNSASFFLEAKSTDPSSKWNIQLRPGHPMVKAWGSGHSEKPHGWHRNDFDDGDWTSPSAETHTDWSRRHGMSPGVWCQSHKFTAYRISPSRSGSSVATGGLAQAPAQQAMICRPVPNPHPQFAGNIFFKYKMHQQDGCMCENGACFSALFCTPCAIIEAAQFAGRGGIGVLVCVPFFWPCIIEDTRRCMEKKIWEFHRRHNDPTVQHGGPATHDGACIVAICCAEVMIAENLFVKRKFESWQRGIA